MRALIADDDPVAAMAVSRSMSHWGFETVVVHDGLAAWEHLTSSDPPPLAIVDWEMPGPRGARSCAGACAPTRRARTCIYSCFTARNSPDDLVAGLEAGADDYLDQARGPERTASAAAAGRRACGLASGTARRRRSPSSRQRSTTCRQSARTAAHLQPTASASATTRITGSASRSTCRSTPTRRSRTASARPCLEEAKARVRSKRRELQRRARRAARQARPPSSVRRTSRASSDQAEWLGDVGVGVPRRDVVSTQICQIPARVNHFKSPADADAGAPPARRRSCRRASRCR